ncbi:MAG: pilus assembly protein [Betaproteobacteria bacterium]|nr:pilus assembly protein [Betaproteobacteria bacterium]
MEFALTGSVLLMLVFGTLELGRIFLAWNSALEVTRRAARDAAVLGFDALPYARNDAVLQPEASGDSAAFPALGEITAAAVSIRFMSGPYGALMPAGALPTSATQNQWNCAQGLSPCITAVQATLCQPGSDPCQPLRYLPVGIPGVPLNLFLPLSPVTVPLEGAGAVPG